MDLIEHANRYVAFKRHMGLKFVTQAQVLRMFANQAVARGERFIRASDVIEFASQATTREHADFRLRILAALARWLRAEDCRHEVVPRQALGRAQRRRVLPYLLEPQQIREIMDAASSLGPAGSINPYTYHYMIGLIACTGIRLSEAVALKLNDVSPDGLLIRESKCGKSRLLPLHDSTRRALHRYLEVRKRKGGPGDHLFVISSGKPPHSSNVTKTFLKLARQTGHRGGPGEPGTRLHDLRHAFATRSLENSLAADDKSVSRHILALSTYLGHVSLNCTYWYLHATPALLRTIGDAAESAHLRRACK